MPHVQRWLMALLLFRLEHEFIENPNKKKKRKNAESL